MTGSTVALERMGPHQTFQPVYTDQSPLSSNQVAATLVVEPPAGSNSMPQVVLMNRSGNAFRVTGPGSQPIGLGMWAFSALGQGPTAGQLAGVRLGTNEIDTIYVNPTSATHAPFARGVIDPMRHGVVRSVDQPEENRVVIVTDSHLLVLDRTDTTPAAISFEVDVITAARSASSMITSQVKVCQVIANSQSAFVLLSQPTGTPGLNNNYIARFDFHPSAPTLIYLDPIAGPTTNELLDVDPTGLVHIRIQHQYWSHGPNAGSGFLLDPNAFQTPSSSQTIRSIHFPRSRWTHVSQTPLSNPGQMATRVTPAPLARVDWSGRDSRIDPLYPDEFHAQIQRQHQAKMGSPFPESFTVRELVQRMAALGAADHFGSLAPEERANLGIQVQGFSRLEVIEGRENDRLTLEQLTRALSQAALHYHREKICRGAVSTGH